MGEGVGLGVCLGTNGVEAAEAAAAVSFAADASVEALVRERMAAGPGITGRTAMTASLLNLRK
jgi:hypothetical protein